MSGHNSRTFPVKGTGRRAEKPYLDEEEAREQEANWEETMEAAHAAHVADEEALTQNHPQSQPDKNNLASPTHVGNTTTNVAPPNVGTIPAATNLVHPTPTSGPAPTPRRRGRPSFVKGNPVSPRGRGRTTPRQNASAAPSPPAQPRVVRPDLGSSSQIPASPSNAAVPCSGSGSMPQGPLVRPNLQAQRTAPFRPPTVTRETMAAASPTIQSRFTGFMPTPSLKKKKPSGPPPSNPSTNDKN
ncbi:uncharacterized protein DS421_5g156820 [Arachis hypogaea]|nr:uncharacterized protein DS421_5g156820 [Arachis hypogaea]